MSKKILITGSNGLLGQKLVSLLKNDHQLLATSTGQNIINDKSNYSYSSLDITDAKSVELLFHSFKPDVVINTAAMTNVDGCEDEKNKCFDINVKAVQTLADLCQDSNAHLIHISTDFIFDGQDGPYKEDDLANPLSYYGKSKYESELVLDESKANWTILRTIILYGTADNLKRNNIVLWGRKALKDGQSLNIIDDQFRSPTLAEDLAQACRLALEKNAFGIFNVSGKDIMSIFEMVERMADFYKCDKSNINKISSDTLNQKAKRPPKTGFVLDKAIKELGYQPHSFEQGLQILENQLIKE
ncbi:MAG: dTDP-4-dehydrorhamnose reductase [Flavobacteriales bacterium]|mgnify:FL=1|jgi:dTDP-4-dehydrorhamnose reductase|tara:strand:- start:460 stop:1362 length:903 start_codon:yes stop_codon:yes gene_type:complete